MCVTIYIQLISSHESTLLAEIVYSSIIWTKINMETKTTEGIIRKYIDKSRKTITLHKVY